MAHILNLLELLFFNTLILMGEILEKGKLWGKYAISVGIYITAWITALNSLIPAVRLLIPIEISALLTVLAFSYICAQEYK